MGLPADSWQHRKELCLHERNLVLGRTGSNWGDHGQDLLMVEDRPARAILFGEKQNRPSNMPRRQLSRRVKTAEWFDRDTHNQGIDLRSDRGGDDDAAEAKSRAIKGYGLTVT
jgi:hypothetical protein